MGLSEIQYLGGYLTDQHGSRELLFPHHARQQAAHGVETRARLHNVKSVCVRVHPWAIVCLPETSDCESPPAKLRFTRKKLEEAAKVRRAVIECDPSEKERGRR